MSTCVIFVGHQDTFLVPHQGTSWAKLAPVKMVRRLLAAADKTDCNTKRTKLRRFNAREVFTVPLVVTRRVFTSYRVSNSFAYVFGFTALLCSHFLFRRVICITDEPSVSPRLHSVTHQFLLHHFFVTLSNTECSNN